MSIEAPWVTAALIAAMPLAFVIAPLLGVVAARLRRRLAIAAALRRDTGGRSKPSSMDHDKLMRNTTS